MSANATPPLDDAARSALRAAAEAALQPLRPVLQGDGGDATVVEVTPEGIALIGFSGHCVGCPASAVTMRLGIERALLTAVSELRGVAEAPRSRPLETRGTYSPSYSSPPDSTIGSSVEGVGTTDMSRRSGAVKSPFAI